MIGKAFDRMVAIENVATKTEKKIIDRLMKLNREELIYYSITELAASINVAEATIIRFVRKLGYTGFQDFKLSISKEMGTIETDKTSITQNIALRMTDAINETYKSLDYELCKKIAKLIINAKKIGAFGVGNSYIAAVEIGNVLARIGINILTTSDPHLQAMITGNMNSEDVIILFSVSGSTKDILDVADIAKKNGVTIVVITCYDKSPLAKETDLVLYSTRREAAYEGGSLSTVVSISFIIDCLYNAIYEELGSTARERALAAASSVANKSI